jgi:glycosyltransferase involved in cell wall biosynthesis
MTYAPRWKPSTGASSSALLQQCRPSPPLRIALISNHRRFKVYFRGYPWARELAARGHDVDLFCHANTEVFRTRVEHADGFRIIESPDVLVGAARQGWDPYCAMRRGLFMFREGKRYDIIHCLDTRLAVIWPALAYARARGIPIVSDWIDWWGRGGLIEERRPSWYKATLGGVETWFEEHYRAKLDGLTAISHALMRRGVNLGCEPDRCIVINGAADMATFATPATAAEARARVGLPLDAPVMCFSGLDVLTDLPLAIRAFELAHAQMSDARLLLVGPTEAEARTGSSSQTALGAIKALGRVPYKELPSVLPAADLFLLPYPGKVANIGRWPNKISDYMAVGRPTVANPVGELSELFRRNPVGLLAGETAEEMAASALRLLRDPGLAEEIGQGARAAAETELCWSSQITRLESWYRDILTERP